MSQPRIALSLVIHNHQPVGNFDFVFEDNHRLAYAPLLEALDRHPGVRVGLHYTGPLLEWLAAAHPETIERVDRLVAREQVEILGGGLYEPVLASLPEHDRVAQLSRMADAVEDRFGRRPRGAWLAERVWEPDLPTSLSAAGYEYTILDDAHFRSAAIPDERHWGAYSTDDQGRRLLVFGTEQGLRYHIPFRPVEEVIAYLRSHATEDGERVGVMGDDGEKFGAWPGTWELCWSREHWIERFFTALEENADWLATVRPSDAIDARPPVGRAYVPTGSYAEMGEWALPVEQRRQYARLLHAARAAGRPEARWMRGGFWRNFQVTYREINDLHKQMLRVSRKVDAMVAAGADGSDTERLARIVDHLHRGQSNDCYWHGLFGGIYLAHLRLATLAHLIAAEDGADRLAAELPVEPATEPVAAIAVETADFDIDGTDELLVRTPGQVVLLKPSEGGGIGSWDVRAPRHALASVMRRRPEAYHETLQAVEKGEDLAEQGAVSIDDQVKVTESGLSTRLWYDAYERRSGLVHLLAPGTTPETFARAEHVELGDFLDRPFEVTAVDAAAGSIVLERLGRAAAPGGDPVPVRVRSELRIEGDRLSPALGQRVRVANEGSAVLEALLGVEWNLNLLGGGGNPQAWCLAGGERRSFDQPRVTPDTAAVAMGNDTIGIALASGATPSAAAWWSSIDTVSVSEQGFERVHQGGCLLWVWPLRLAPGESVTVTVDNDIMAAVDRAHEERL